MMVLARILALLSQLVFLSLPVEAQWIMNSYRFGVTPPPSNTFVGCASDTTDLTTYSFSSVGTGTADAARKTIILVAAEDATADFDASSMTVDGNSATLTKTSHYVTTTDGAPLVETAAFIIDNPTGTTSNISVTFSEAVTSATICVYAAYDLTSTAALSIHPHANNFSVLDLWLGPAAQGGYSVAIVANPTTSNTVTWTGATENVDSASAEIAYSTASIATSTLASGPSDVKAVSTQTLPVGLQITYPTSTTLVNTILSCVADSNDRTTYTFTAVPTGLADSTRVNLITVGGEDNAATFTVSTLTVGGVGATAAVNTNNATSFVQASIWAKTNASGTNADIVVTWSEAVSNTAICIWATYDVASTTATATNNQYTATCSSAVTVSLNVGSGGWGVGTITAVQADSGGVWTGMTERATSSAGTDSSTNVADTNTSGTPLAVTAGMSASGGAHCLAATAAFN